MYIHVFCGFSKQPPNKLVCFILFVWFVGGSIPPRTIFKCRTHLCDSNVEHIYVAYLRRNTNPLWTSPTRSGCPPAARRRRRRCSRSRSATQNNTQITFQLSFYCSLFEVLEQFLDLLSIVHARRASEATDWCLLSWSPAPAVPHRDRRSPDVVVYHDDGITAFNYDIIYIRNFFCMIRFQIDDSRIFV